MGWIKDGKLYVPNHDENVEVTEKDGVKQTLSGIEVVGETQPKPIPGWVKRKIRAFENKQRRKAIRDAARQRLEAAYPDRRVHASDIKGDK